MDEDTFWSIVSALGGSASDTSLLSLTERLETLTSAEVDEFGEMFGRRLYELDTELAV
jgi:hypothetical protein